MLRSLYELRRLQMARKMSKAEKAGRAMARTIIEMAELLWDGKKDFYKGLIDVLSCRHVKKDGGT